MSDDEFHESLEKVARRKKLMSLSFRVSHAKNPFQALRDFSDDDLKLVASRIDRLKFVPDDEE